MKKLLLTTAFVALAFPAMAEEYTVKMVTNFDADQMYYFEPAELTIQPGDTVKWINVQEDMHNAVADAGPKGAELFESPMLEEENASWSFTFAKDGAQGTYSYHCHPHAAMGMKGTIIVGQASGPEEMEGAAGHGEHAHGAPDSNEDEGMKMKDGAMMDHGSMPKKTSDDGHGDHGDNH